MIVFVLEHSHIFHDGGESNKLIGIYSTEADAQAAANRLRPKPGFSDAPDGFTIDAYTINEDNWEEGYVTNEQ